MPSGLLKKESIDYTNTFSPVFKKDSLRIILVLVASQIDVKTTFLNGDLQAEIYMAQPFGFSQERGQKGWQ